MAFLMRLSENFWSYVSPSKSTQKAPAQKTPQTLPKSKPKRKPGRPPRSASIHAVVQHSRSMSPIERVDSWAARATSEASSSKKRKLGLVTPSTGAGRKRKSRRLDGEIADVNSEVVDEGSEVSDVDESDTDNINVAVKSQSPDQEYEHEYNGFYYNDDEEDGDEVDDTLVVSEHEYQEANPGRKKIIAPEEAHFDRGVSSEELRKQGWDDDHITLTQHIVLRGFEPLMPQHWKFDYRFMPDSLFADTDEAIISSARGDHYHGTRALEDLLDLGGHVRDRVILKGRTRPEQQVRKTLTKYIKWMEQDSGLDKSTAVPLLAIETQPAHVDARILQDNARRKLAALAARYREFFKVSQSIENSPASRTSTQLSYPVPTLYAIIASHTLVALTAYNPEDAHPEIKSVAFFDMKDKDYDVWNSLALAIVVCHLRNVQLRIAEETGLGLKVEGMEEEEEEIDDPDA